MARPIPQPEPPAAPEPAPFVSVRVPAPKNLRDRLLARAIAVDEADWKMYTTGTWTIRHGGAAILANNIEAGETVEVGRAGLTDYIPDLPAGIRRFRIGPSGAVTTLETAPEQSPLGRRRAGKGDLRQGPSSALRLHQA
jgi:hypothetical protein